MTKVIVSEPMNDDEVAELRRIAQFLTDAERTGANAAQFMMNPTAKNAGVWFRIGRRLAAAEAVIVKRPAAEIGGKLPAPPPVTKLSALTPLGQ